MGMNLDAQFQETETEFEADFGDVVMLKGDKGDKGEQGIQGIQGEKGEPGKDGTRVSVSTIPIQGDPHDPNLSGTVLAITTFDPNTGSATDTYISIFNGKDGKTPVRGTDYWTDADKEEIKSYVDEAILGGAW